MVKKVLIGLIVISLLGALVTACGVKDASTITIPTVHLGAMGFIQDSIILRKGEVLDLVDDSVSPHQIENGSWVIDVAKPAVEPGTPLVNQVFNGYDSAEIGPDRSELDPFSKDGLAQIKKGSKHLFHTTEKYLGTHPIHEKDSNE